MAERSMAVVPRHVTTITHSRGCTQRRDQMADVPLQSGHESRDSGAVAEPLLAEILRCLFRIDSFAHSRVPGNRHSP